MTLDCEKLPSCSQKDIHCAIMLMPSGYIMKILAREHPPNTVSDSYQVLVYLTLTSITSDFETSSKKYSTFHMLHMTLKLHHLTLSSSKQNMKEKM